MDCLQDWDMLIFLKWWWWLNVKMCFLPKPNSNSDSLFLLQQGTRSKFILSPQGLSLRGKYCYISLHSATTIPLTSPTPLTLTLTYTFFTSTVFSYLQIHPTISSSALTTLLSLILVLLNYHSLPYLFLVL